jgi:hypothetical protein
MLLKMGEMGLLTTLSAAARGRGRNVNIWVQDDVDEDEPSAWVSIW